ncbi:MAG: Inner rane protein YbhL [Sphingobacteriaceae bacterium]|jgi:FtsH-binding integral membrane protein|nr:Inner rane protein YbhL [Sphingobacteriaceae bacterium]
METNFDNSYKNVIQLDDEASNTKKFMGSVFLWMFVALGLSATFAYLFSQNNELLAMLRNPETLQPTTLGTVTMIAPLIFVLTMSFGFNKLSYSALAIIFVAYSAVTGMSLSFIMLIYTASSVFTCFLSASALFGVMAVAGYRTNVDLTNFGSILMMFLVGIIIASVINMFLGSGQLDYIISFVGVAVFVGLTAYDVQKLKRIGSGEEYGEAPLQKMAVMGALRLYLDFINMFLMLLRLFGSRK